MVNRSLWLTLCGGVRDATNCKWNGWQNQRSIDWSGRRSGCGRYSDLHREWLKMTYGFLHLKIGCQLVLTSITGLTDYQISHYLIRTWTFAPSATDFILIYFLLNNIGNVIRYRLAEVNTGYFHTVSRPIPSHLPLSFNFEPNETTSMMCYDYETHMMFHSANW